MELVGIPRHDARLLGESFEEIEIAVPDAEIFQPRVIKLLPLLSVAPLQLPCHMAGIACKLVVPALQEFDVRIDLQKSRKKLAFNVGSLGGISEAGIQAETAGVPFPPLQGR